VQKRVTSKNRQRKTRGFLLTLAHSHALRAVEIDRRLLPNFLALAFRENFPTWKHLFIMPSAPLLRVRFRKITVVFLFPRLRMGVA
jgi:hypothetical protein